MLDEEYSFFLYVYQGVRNNLDAVSAPRLLEAAQMLGAGKFYAFWRIILPNITNGIMVSVMLAMSIVFGDFRNYQYTGRKLFPDRTDVPVFGNETVRTEGKCRDRDSVYYHAGNFTCGIWSAEKQEKEIREDVLHRVSEYQQVLRKKTRY